MNDAERQADLVQKVAEALEHDRVLKLFLYCDAQGCSVREVNVKVKDDFRDCLDQVQSRGCHCPVCGATLKVHEVGTRQDVNRASELDARMSVNLQMYKRDHQAKTGEELDLIPASRIVDHRLPPTPSGWFPDETT